MGRQLSCVKKSRLSQSYRGRKSREREAEAVIASCNADTCQTNGDLCNVPREAAGHCSVVELQPASSGWRVSETLLSSSVLLCCSCYGSVKWQCGRDL